MKTRLSMALLLIMSAIAFAEPTESGKKDRIGPRKAVLEASEKEGLRLSEAAIKNLELNLLLLRSSSSISVPTSALVRFQDFIAVYRERDGWFRMVEIEPVINRSSARFSSKDFQPGDRIVTANAGLLRVIDLDIFGPEADACAD